MIVALLHSNGQLRTERGGDTENGQLRTERGGDTENGCKKNSCTAEGYW